MSTPPEPRLADYTDPLIERLKRMGYPTASKRRAKTYLQYKEGYIRERRRVWRLRKQIKQRARGAVRLNKMLSKVIRENMKFRRELRERSTFRGIIRAIKEMFNG